jgi:hypothetical protein
MVGELLACVSPELIVVCDDEWPSERRASAEMLVRFQEHAPIVLTTRKAGAIRLRFHPDGWEAIDAVGVRLAGSATLPPKEHGPRGEKTCSRGQ